MKRLSSPRRGRVVTQESALPLFASAKRRQEHQKVGTKVLDRPTDAPEFISSGLRSLDKILQGGFPVGELSLVAARPKVGATSLLMGMGLDALKAKHRVAYLSERLEEKHIRGRFVVLESKINGHRFRAGFISAEDRVALNVAREHIPWASLSLITKKTISNRVIDSHFFSYHPRLVLADLRTKLKEHGRVERLGEPGDTIATLKNFAKKHQIAIVLRYVLPKRNFPPDRLELPGLGAFANQFHTACLLHREEVTNPNATPDNHIGMAELNVIRLKNKDIEPRDITLGFDQRYAGFNDL
ncbi:MAG: DnaB-like helicase C-terminal domain-containing protein [Myxococcota bacterium]|jgi:replicative DNA helicase|nr:DnaB-like helicase C-terminal domain-containing protein [Myxococcota bacterium]